MSIQIIAELGQGFEGSFEQANLLLRAAASADANAAKFQLVYADELATEDYQYHQLFRTLEMQDSEWEELASNAKKLKIDLQLDIFGERSLQLASKIGASGVKIHATDIANQSLLNSVAQSSVRSVLLGAGGALNSEVQQAIRILEGKELSVLFGFQAYPTPLDANQIARVFAMKRKLAQSCPSVKMGFADHATPDSCIALASAAIALGAEVIEKHLTLGRIMKLEDYESALNPDEFAKFSEAVRGCEQAIGQCADSDTYGMGEPEQRYRKMIRRHVVASHEIERGTVLGPEDVVLKRTSNGSAITSISEVYGKELSRDISCNAPLTSEDLV